MKNISIILSILGFSLSGFLNAQTGKTTVKSTNDQSVFDPADAKAKFVNNKDYLSPSTLKDYNSYYGDSLKGFDETQVKIELLNRNYFGTEFINVMNFRKRQFINNKYKLGPQFAPRPTPPSTGNSPGRTIGNGPGFVNTAPCNNEDFESTTPGTYTGPSNSLAVTGWLIENISTLGNQLACNTPSAPTFSPGSPEFSIVATPVLGHPYIGNLGNSPLGGNNVAVLNNASPGFTCTRISSTFPVTQSNSLFQFAYAGSWDGTGHQCCDQPFFLINMFDCNGQPLGCSSLSLTPPGNFCQNGTTGYSTTTGGISYTNWQVKYIDLTPYIGSCVTIKVVNGDCNGGAHHGSLYFDAKCGGQLLCPNCSLPSGTVQNVAGPVSYCAGSGVASISAPLGYATYSWIAPGGAPAIPSSQATLATLNITSPVPNSVYTVMLTSPSGCVFQSTNAIVVTSVNIAGIGSAPSCAGGASGSATVSGNGSGAGYNYTWTSSSNSVVGTSSIATGLAPGVYTVVITGLGSAGCGSAAATTTVGIRPNGVLNLYKPYCGSVAYLTTTGGSNFQWFNNTTAIPTSSGGTASSITINNPTNGAVITLTCLNQGCQDSTRFTLAQTTPGFMSAQNISYVCPGGSNGTAVINMAPAAGAPSGYNTYSVVATGTSTPSYTAFTGPTSQINFPINGLSAGTYSVNGYDGACTYTTTFAVNSFTFSYTLTPVPSTLCPGNSIAAAITFTSPPALTQYTYSWTPNVFMTGNTFQSTIITPTTAVGTQTTIIYNVVVTPSLINCPVTKQLTITAVNPSIPTITAIPNLCNTFQPYTIITSPTGGTFNAGVSGTNNPIVGGIITPSLAPSILNPTAYPNGNNTFTYAISVSTCVATQTANYQVSKFYSSALSSPTVAPMCVTNSAFNLMNIVQSTVNGVWLGTGVQNGTSFNPANLNTNNYVVTYSTSSSPNPTVCPSTTTLNIPVTKTITPFIAPVAEFCTNSPVFNMTVNPTGGGWVANSWISNSGVVTPSLLINAPPSSNATYTVIIGPCFNSNTTTVYVSQFHSATLSGTVNPLCYNSANVNLMSIAPNAAYGTWSGPSGGGVASNSFIPAGLSTGIYVATYKTVSSPNSTLCPGISTIAISVLNPPVPTITQIGPICNNASPIQLTVTPNTGQWTSSPYLNSTGVFTPSLTIAGNNAVQYIIGTSTCNVQQTKLISVEAFVPATIIGSIPDLCNTGVPINLSPFTSNNLGNWTGNGITGSSFDPAAAGTGHIILTYHTASSPSGLCPDQAVVSVNVYSLATPIVTSAGPFCNNSLPIQLQVSPVGGYFGGPNLGVVSRAGKFNPASALIGDNMITYSIAAGPCVAYAQTIVKVEAFVSADFIKPAGPFCKNGYPLNMNSIALNPGGNWSGPGMIGDMFNPAVADIGNTNLVIYETHSSQTFSLCPDTSAIRIEVRDFPTVMALSNIKEGCSPLEVIFNTPNVNSGEGLWSIDDGSEPVKGLTTSHVFTRPGNYNIQFNYADGIGCKAAPVSIFPPITVYDVPKPDFQLPDEILISDPRIEIVNQTQDINNSTYQWTVENIMPISTDVHLKVEFTKIGKYDVTLAATNIHGCKAEIRKTIEVKNDFSIFIPNSFTPNYDGLNDVFEPKFANFGLDLKNFEMEIFDRWGHSLYRTKDVTKGWDGSFQNKGEPLKEDTYVYKIRYKDLDGNVYNKMGNFSLIK